MGAVTVMAKATLSYLPVGLWPSLSLGLFFRHVLNYGACMSITIRPARHDEAGALTELCLRSKAYWGYDEAFMAACRQELTVRPGDNVTVAEVDGTPAGIARIDMTGEVADLEKLFVDPTFIGTGLGRRLFEWCAAEARRMGANRMMIEADPGAAPFYEAMGAIQVGVAPSAVFAGRELPLLDYKIT